MLITHILFGMFGEAVFAGLLASLGSTLGKLSGSANIVGDSYVIWLSLLIVMVLANTCGCRYYLRALDACDNSVTPTVISSASNYVFSGVVGIFFFEEGASVRWCMGASIIIMGLTLVARTQKKHVA